MYLLAIQRGEQAAKKCIDYARCAIKYKYRNQRDGPMVTST